MAELQGFMQDENVACHDIGKLSFERAVGCFGTPQLERATCFAMTQLERATSFPNVPSRARDSLSNDRQFEVCAFGWVFFYNNYYFLSQYAFHVYELIVLIKA